MLHSCIGLYVRSRRADMEQRLRRVLDFLSAHHVEVLVEQGCHQLLPHGLQDAGQEVFAPNNPPERISLFVVAGGDGTFLHACQQLHQHNKPITGINFGSLGFLTDIGVEQLEEQLLPVLRGEGQSDVRYFIQLRNKHLPGNSLALNDLVVQNSEAGKVVKLKLWIDGRLAYQLRCDGIIVATATGSTAYALSAGGPLLHSGVDAMVLVPLAAHNLAARPSVIPANSKVEIELTGNSLPANVNADGQQLMVLASGERISLGKSKRSVTLVHPPCHDLCAAWRAKLGWS